MANNIDNNIYITTMGVWEKLEKFLLDLEQSNRLGLHNLEVMFEDNLIELVYYTRGTEEEIFSKELYQKFRNQIEKLTHVFLDNDGFTYGGKLVYEDNTVTDYYLDDEYFTDYEAVDMDDTQLDIEEYWHESGSKEI